MGNHRSYVDAILFRGVSWCTWQGCKPNLAHHWLGCQLARHHLGDRKSKDSRRATRQTVMQRLQEGAGIVIFPEGTTHKGPDLLDYRPGMFYSCAEEGIPIVPVALSTKTRTLPG